MLILLWLPASAALLGASRALAGRRAPAPACSASELRERLKEVLESTSTSEALRSALMSSADLGRDLRPLVGAMAPRVAKLSLVAPGIRSLGDFEERACELMAAGRWIEAHDVVAGQLLEGGTHAHDAVLAARLLEGVCQYELACADGLMAALAAHEADKAVPLPCGCVVSPEVVEPFADLANAWAALDEGEANEAFGHALAAGLARPTLAGAAATVARRAEETLELLADAVAATGGDEGEGEGAASSPGAAELVFPAGQEGAAGQEEPSEAEGLPALAALHELVGLKEVKAHCQNLCDAVALEKERGDDPKQKSFSLVVTGNPGTGKTAFAQLYGQLLGGPAG